MFLRGIRRYNSSLAAGTGNGGSTTATTTPSSITGILKDMNLIRSQPKRKHPFPLNESAEVEVVYRDLKSESKGQPREMFHNKMANQLRIYNNTNNFKSLFILLKKFETVEQGEIPNVDVYNQVFRALLLSNSIARKSTRNIRGHEIGNDLAAFALKLVDECHVNGVELNDTSFHYLDKVIANSNLIQLQLQYQEVLESYERLSISFLIATGQYERSLEMFYEMIGSEDNNGVQLDQEFLLAELKINQMILFSLSRADYGQVRKFIEIILERSSDMVIEPRLWSNILAESVLARDYELTKFSFDQYIKPRGVGNFAESTLARICDIFAQQGDTVGLLECIDSMNMVFKKSKKNDVDAGAGVGVGEGVEAYSIQLGKVAKSYCQDQGYIHAWEMIDRYFAENGNNQAKRKKLNKQDFVSMIDHYKYLRFGSNLEELVKAVSDHVKTQEAKDIVYYTIIKKLHNDTNLTGICHFIDLMNSPQGELDQIWKNYDIIIHSIARSNSSKIFTYNFVKLLIQNEEASKMMDGKKFYYLLQNSKFSDGEADDYNLTKYLISIQLDHFKVDLTPKEIQLLKELKDDKIDFFLKQYLEQNNAEKETNIGMDQKKTYTNLIPYDERILTITTDDTPTTTTTRTGNKRQHIKYKNYYHHYDLENNKSLLPLLDLAH